MFKHALTHCKKVYKSYNCKRVKCIGDILDHHRISRHTSEPDSDGAEREKMCAIQSLKPWYKAFPKVDIILGNHDMIPYRQAKEIGIPASYLQKIKHVYKMPKGWEFYTEIVEDNVLYMHEIGSGMYGAINMAKRKGMSVVGGHTHTAGGIVYFRNALRLFFGMNAGCLINKDTYAMRYTNTEPTLGCGVVYSASEAYFIPCNLKG